MSTLTINCARLITSDDLASKGKVTRSLKSRPRMNRAGLHRLNGRIAELESIATMACGQPVEVVKVWDFREEISDVHLDLSDGEAEDFGQELSGSHIRDQLTRAARRILGPHSRPDVSVEMPVPGESFLIDPAGADTYGYREELEDTVTLVLGS